MYSFEVIQIGQFVAVFNNEQEQEFVEHIKNVDAYFYGLSFKNLYQLAYQFT